MQCDLRRANEEVAQLKKRLASSTAASSAGGSGKNAAASESEAEENVQLDAKIAHMELTVHLLQKAGTSEDDEQYNNDDGDEAPTGGEASSSSAAASSSGRFVCEMSIGSRPILGVIARSVSDLRVRLWSPPLPPP